MDISIIIVNYNVVNDVIICINSAINTLKDLDYEIFVVDNNSPDRSVEKVQQQFNRVTLIQLKENKGFGYANNKAAAIARGEYLLFTNPDIIFQDNTINELHSFISNNGSVGCAGPLIIRPDGSIQYYYTFFPSTYSRLMQEFGFYETAKQMKKRKFDFLNSNIEKQQPFKVNWVLGACMIIPRRLFTELTGFDDNFFLYEEEVDLLYRMKEYGRDTYFVPTAKVVHNHNTSTSLLGFAFIRYHGFRSIIIYSNKHNRGVKRLFSKMLLTFGILLRYIRGIISNKFRLGNFSSHTVLFYDLLKLNFFKLGFSAKDHSHFVKANSALAKRDQ
ncbi:MAG: glycosyltransferase family 2 protein [Ignavibacteria bacterium]|nr:glycosyltransferase family 2 protein [Ignavibacteria bacterium]